MRDTVIQMAEIFKAFGDPTRLRIIKMLASNPERKLCVGAIANTLGITQPAVSQHLKVLKNVRLIDPNRDGFQIHYAINPETLADFRKYLDALSELAFVKCPYEDGCQKQGEEISGAP